MTPKMITCFLLFFLLKITHGSRLINSNYIMNDDRASNGCPKNTWLCLKLDKGLLNKAIYMTAQVVCGWAAAVIWFR